MSCSKLLRLTTEESLEAIRRWQAIIKNPSLLHSAVRPGDQDNIHWTPLHYCARHGLVKPCEWLLSSVPKRNRRRLVNSPDHYNDTPLSDAAYWGHTTMARFLLGKGADVNALNSRGQTPLYRAVMKNDLDMVKLLVEEGHADVNATIDAHGNTLAHAIAYRADKDVTVKMLTYLLQQGLDTRCINKYGDTPFMRACRVYNVRLAEKLRSTITKSVQSSKGTVQSRQLMS